MTPLNLIASLAALAASAAFVSPLALGGSASSVAAASATSTAAQVASARSAQTASRSTARTAPAEKTAAKSAVKAENGEDADTSTGSTESAAATCKASHYWEDTQTASGQPFNVNAMKAAHKTLPMGTKVRVTNPKNGKSVVVTINDRGPYIAGRCLDLTTGAFRKIANPSAGVITVRYSRL